MEKLRIPPFLGFDCRPDITVPAADGRVIGTLPGYTLWAVEFWPAPISVTTVCGGYYDGKPVLGYELRVGRRKWFIRVERR